MKHIVFALKSTVFIQDIFFADLISLFAYLPPVAAHFRLFTPIYPEAFAFYLLNISVYCLSFSHNGKYILSHHFLGWFTPQVILKLVLCS